METKESLKKGLWNQLEFAHDESTKENPRWGEVQLALVEAVRLVARIRDEA
jgi:hypothetical protein